MIKSDLIHAAVMLFFLVALSYAVMPVLALGFLIGAVAVMPVALSTRAIYLDA